MLGPLLRILIVGLVLLVAIMFAMPRPLPPIETDNATVLPSAMALPEFTLADVDGEPFTNASLEGRFTLMFFGFTNCPDVCPITLQVLASTIERLREDAPEKVPDVVFVSVDPFRDTPDRIRAYLRGFDPGFIGVTGPDERLEPLVTKLGVGVEKHEHHGEHYNVVHSGVVYVIGPRAEWIALSSAPHVPETIASDFVKIREGYLRRPPDIAN
jgi:protein SCO1/2